MFKKIIHTKNFWRSVVTFGIAFIFLYNIINIAFRYKFNFSEYFGHYFQSEYIFSFIFYNIIGGLIYGFAVVYFRFWRFYKEHDRQQ